MAQKEVFFLIGTNGEILHREEGSSSTFIPDSRSRWEIIWENRDQVAEVSHSHPIGPLAFSAEDESTMSAIASALGRHVLFSVVAPKGMVRREVWPEGRGEDQLVEDEPPWAAEMRAPRKE